jgi:3-methyladenine DNA glycosylase AlkC
MSGLELFDDLVNEDIRRDVIEPVLCGNFKPALAPISKIQRRLYDNIPEKKRISYGRYYTVRVFGARLYGQLVEEGGEAFEFSVYAFSNSRNYLVRGVALEMIAQRGLDAFECVLPYFEAAASDGHWEMREFAAGFFRKLVKAHPQRARNIYLGLVASPNPYLRRFVSESLRPVSENGWLRTDPEYALSILQRMFRERAAYPRTSVGNNLSDWSRLRPDLVYAIVEDLVANGDKDSYWIAYRACRNLVKKEPLRVMNILAIDEYKYKDRVHQRDDYL